METIATGPTGLSWSDLGKTVLSKGIDLADSYAAIAVAKEQTKAQTQVQAAEVAAAAAPNNVATKANTTGAGFVGLSTGAKVGIGAGVAAVLGLVLWAIFGRRK